MNNNYLRAVTGALLLLLDELLDDREVNTDDVGL
jgi:hypothetical protein